MDINYDLIIKYLVKKNDTKKKEKYNFITQKNIFNYSVNFPDKLKNLLTDKFYRYGITVYDNENNDISFWTSLLTLLDKKFNASYLDDEVSMINEFKLKLIEKYDKKLLSNAIKNFDKNDFKERLKLNPDVYLIQYLVDILDINIIILDFVSFNINVVYPKDLMNPWKQILMFAKYKNNWEPIMLTKIKGEIQRTFDMNNIIIKKILDENNIEYYDKDIIKKDYIVINSIEDAINMEKTKLGIKLNDKLIEEDSDSTVHTDSEKELFVKEEFDEIKKLNKTKMKAMKLEQLSNITKKLNISVPDKKPTKSTLMTLILNKINNSTS
jgi:hypothetical protein